MNELEIGGAADFPLARYDYVVSCRTRLQTTTNKTFTSKIDNERDVVTITRGEDKPEAMKQAGFLNNQ